MTGVSAAAGGDALTEAQATIARQVEEIAVLRRRLADERTAEEVRAALAVAAGTGRLAAPVEHGRLLELIVETAAQVIGARSGALFLVDDDTQELIFEVALGPKAAEVKKFRVPLGHGIAGLVAVSGQAMAVSDAASDPRQAADIARSVGYVPQSILCVPLFYGDRVTGVLELLDKEGAPSFGPGDISTLGLFANQAAVAIEQSRVQGNIGALLDALLPPGEVGGAPPRDRVRDFAARLETEDAAFRESLALADLVQEIAWRGERERQAVRAILEGFAAYLRDRPDPIDFFGGIG
jgi:GAF domain-containing protein